MTFFFLCQVPPTGKINSIPPIVVILMSQLQMDQKSSSNDLLTSFQSDIKNVEPASSLWREKLALRGLKENTPSIKYSSMQPNFALQNATCLATHTRFNVVAHANRSTSNTHVVQFVLCKPGPSDSTDYDVLVRTRVPGPVHDMHWISDKLIVASSGGAVYFYKTLTENFVHFHESQRYSVTKQLWDVKWTQYLHPKLKNVSSIPSPEQWTHSSRINCIGINERDSDVFFAIENHRLHIWNFERQKAPIHSIKGSNGPLLCGQWNPHNSNELMISGVTRNLKLLDYRQLDGTNGVNRFVAWKKNDAHSDSIRDLKWNPLIPYWVATAGNDGIINVWDLRYNADPVISLEGHDNIVRRLSWSRDHVELLASGGIDQQVKIWSLRVQPHYIIATITEPFNDSIIGVDFSYSHPQHCYALSASGEFVTTTMTSKFLEPLVYSKFSEHEQNERNVEKLIYQRKFTAAFKSIIEMATEHKNNNRLDKALQLLDLHRERKISSSIKAIDQKERFRKEVDEYSYYIPPNYSFKNEEVIPYLKQLENMILNCQMLRFVQRNEFNEVSMMERKMLDLLERDINCMETSTLMGVINLYLSHDYKRGMNFVISVGKIFYEKKYFQAFEPIARMILDPTTYEVSHNPTLSESAYRNLNKILANAEHIFAQLALQRDVICSLWGADSANKIVSIVEHSGISGTSSPGYLEIISQATIRSYLNALLCLNRIGQFYIVATELLQKTQGYDFAQVLQDMMQNVAFPKFKQILDDKPEELTENTETSDIINYLKGSAHAILMVYTIANNAAFVPESIAGMISSTLDSVLTNIPYYLKKLTERKDRNQNAIEFVKEIVQQIEIEDSRHQSSKTSSEKENTDESGAFKAKAKKLKTVLINFITEKHKSTIL